MVGNATTILYGTAWSDTTLLAQQPAVNLERQQRTGLRLHFEYDWRTLAALIPAYRAFVEQEIARLGEDHLAIQTQYYLRPISGVGYFLTPFTFTRPGKSRLAYELLALINSSRLKLYADQHAPRAMYEECQRQLRLARYRLPAPDILDFYVDPSDGHDDYLISIALVADALNPLSMLPASSLIHPRRLYDREGRF